MIDVLEKFLKDDTREYELSNSIFDALKKEIKDNSNLIKKANAIDSSFNKYAIDVKKLEDIVEKYKEIEISNENKDKESIVIYTGDPYLTLELLLQAIKKHKRVFLAYNEHMLGTNELIFSIFYEVLKKYKITNLVYSISRVKPELIQELNNIDAKTVVIGDSAVSQLLKNNIYYPYKNYIMYSENEELDDLKEAIYLFTTEYGYELEILYENSINDVIPEVNYSDANNFILLTTNEETKEKVKNEIKNKKIYINENPFKNDEEEIKFYI